MQETVGNGTDSPLPPGAAAQRRPAVQHATRSGRPPAPGDVVPGGPGPGAPSRGLVAGVVLLIVALLTGAGLIVVHHPSSTASSAQSGRSGAVATRCWDGSTSRKGGCPDLDTTNALEWVFTAHPGFTKCAAARSDPQGELEVAQCSWSDLGAVVFISRWDSTASAATYFQGNLGRGSQVDVLPGDGAGEVWSALQRQDGGGPAYAFCYVNYPYSFLVLGSQSERDRAVARLTMRSPQELADQL